MSHNKIVCQTEDVIIELGNVLADTAKELKKYIAAAQIELKDVLEVQIPEAKKRAEHDEFAQHDVYHLEVPFR